MKDKPVTIKEIRRTSFGVKLSLSDGSYCYVDDTDLEVGDVYE